MTHENYIKVGYRRFWVMFDLDNGHQWNSRDIGKGYIWVFESRKKALAHRKAQHSNRDNARLSYPKFVKI